jgi:hypothetical protein
LSKLKHNNIKSGLTKKGFKISDSYSDHVILTFYHNDSPTGVWTKLSHGGGKEIGEGLIHTMASQVKLNKKQFLELIECIMTRDSYVTELRKQNIVF